MARVIIGSLLGALVVTVATDPTLSPVRIAAASGSLKVEAIE